MIALERTVHQVVPHCPATPKPDLPTLLRVPHLHVQSINCPNAFESNKLKKKNIPIFVFQVLTYRTAPLCQEPSAAGCHTLLDAARHQHRGITLAPAKEANGYFFFLGPRQFSSRNQRPGAKHQLPRRLQKNKSRHCLPQDRAEK